MIKVTLEFDNESDAVLALTAVADFREAKAEAKTPKPPVTGSVADTAQRTQSALPKEPGKAIQALLSEHKLQAKDIPASGKNGALTKGDVEAYIRKLNAANSPVQPTPLAVPRDNSADITISSAPIPSIEDCTAALRNVNAVKDTGTVRLILGRFGVDRTSLVPENRRAELIANCEEVLAGSQP